MLPGLGDPVEWITLEAELEAAGEHVVEHLEVCAVSLFLVHREVRVADDRELLGAYVGRAERRVWPRRLADVHDARVRRGMVQRIRQRLAPHRVDADGEALVGELLGDSVDVAPSDTDDLRGLQ